MLQNIVNLRQRGRLISLPPLFLPSITASRGRAQTFQIYVCIYIYI